MNIVRKHTTVMPRVAAITVLFLGAIIGYFNATIAHAASEPANGQRLLTIHDQGIEKGLLTEKTTLREALKEAKIHIDPNDVTEPALDERLVGTQYQVNIYRARPVVIVDGVSRTKIMSPYRTADQIAKQAKLTLQDEDTAELSRPDDMLVDGPVETLTIDRATPFIFIFYGKRIEAYTKAKTIREMLKAKNITPKKDDTLSATLTAPIVANMTVELWHNGKQTVTQEEEVDFPVEKIKDTNHDVGFREVQTPGIKGKKNVTYEIIMKNGKEESRTAINSVTTKEPVKQVEIVGSKPSFTGDFAAALAKLRSCEGGYNSWNPAGPYYGAYQFNQGTWSSVTSAPYGHATPEEQDQAAYQLYLRRGWQPWPVCGRGLPDTYR